jgi:hypothetical protein
MADVEGVDDVKATIRDIYDKRRAAILGIARDYAALMIQWFRANQIAKKWWNNQTGDAMAGIVSLSGGDLTPEGDVSMHANHMMQYGIYLELSNNGKHAALRPMMIEFAGKYIAACRALMEATE